MAARGVRNGFPSNSSVLENQSDFELLVERLFLVPIHSYTAYEFQKIKKIYK